MNMLRTNLEIDQDLLINAMELCDAKTVSEIIENALKELIQTRKQVNLMDIKGTIKFFDDYDYKQMRTDGNII